MSRIRSPRIRSRLATLKFQLTTFPRPPPLQHVLVKKAQRSFGLRPLFGAAVAAERITAQVLINLCHAHVTWATKKPHTTSHTIFGTDNHVDAASMLRYLLSCAPRYCPD